VSSEVLGSRRSLFVIYATLALDAAGIGLVFPILPRLIQDVANTDNIAPYLGWMAALYAAMQFVFAPVLGSLSDRMGRRPILLISLSGSAINYVIMAFAPHLWLLMLSRAIAGLTSANVSVATAYITDITPDKLRPRRFGMMSAMFGAGFIIGPVLGGVLGDHWVRLPFIAAAAFAAGNMLLALFVLSESHAPVRGSRFDPATLNPLRPMRWLFSRPNLLPLVLVYFALSGAGEAYGTCWALWGYDSFAWNGYWVGLSLGAFGAWQALVQAFLPGPAAQFLGQRGAVLTGIGCACAALLGMAFASQGWMVFAIMPLFALGSIGTPALQAIAAGKVEAERQGELQGLLASSVSLASIIAPLGFSSFYFVVQQDWPGAVWLSVIAVNLLAVPFVLMGTRTSPPTHKK
jgi:DHA1 family tetracycline resistance protein-like MFS transporter